MKWQTVEEAGEPTLGERVMVETEEGSMLYAVREMVVLEGRDEQDPDWWEYLDDTGMVIRSPVVRWAHLVAQDETPK